MKKTLILLVFVTAFTALLASCAKEKPETNTQKQMEGKVMNMDHDNMNHADGNHTDSEETLIYYTCPMDSHKHIHSSEPGSCEECGMTLVKAVVTSEEKKEFYGCPMESHSHIRQDTPGSCEICGMTLKPMRLTK